MPNKALKVLFLYNGIFVLAGSLLGPLYALYVEKFNAGVLPVSVSWSVFLFSAALFTYILSKTGDIVKHKRFLLAGGYLVRAVCWLLMGLISNFEELIALQFVLGIGEALGSPSFNAIFAEHLDKNKLIMDYSDWNMISYIVLVIGTLLGGLVVSKFGFPCLMFGMSALAFVSYFGLVVNPHLD